MSQVTKPRLALFAALSMLAAVSFGGCESEGPAEKAGKNIDSGVQKAKDTLNPPGPAEKVGRDIDKAAGK